MADVLRVKVYWGGVIINNQNARYSGGSMIRFQMKEGTRWESFKSKLRKDIGIGEETIITRLTYRCPVFNEGNLSYTALTISNEQDFNFVFHNEFQLGCMEYVEFYVDLGDATCTMSECIELQCRHLEDEPIEDDDLDYYTDGEVDDDVQMDPSMLAADVEKFVKNDASLKVKILQSHIRNRFHIELSYRNTWIAKNNAIQKLYGTWDESYKKLPQLMGVIQIRNPGTIVEWDHHTVDSFFQHSTIDVFHRLFCAFGPCINAFKFLRPVLCVDGTSLYGKYRGALLMALTLTPDNYVIPLAFAIVEDKSESSWAWFLQHIKTHITRSNRVCIVSDCNSGVGYNMTNNVIWQDGKAVHRYCTQHVASDVATLCRDTTLQWKIQRIAALHGVRRFTQAMNELQISNPDCAYYLSGMDVSKWTAAYDGGYRFGIMTTNFKGFYNLELKGVRHLPICEIVEVIFLKSYQVFLHRTLKYNWEITCGHYFLGNVRDSLNYWTDIANKHTVQDINGNTGECHVHTKFNSHTRRAKNEHIVNLKERTCTCGKFQAYHIPCSHAIAACRVIGIDHLKYVSIWYSLQHYQKAFNKTLNLLGPKSSWPQLRVRELIPDVTMMRVPSIKD